MGNFIIIESRGGNPLSSLSTSGCNYLCTYIGVFRVASRLVFALTARLLALLFALGARAAPAALLSTSLQQQSKLQLTSQAS